MSVKIGINGFGRIGTLAFQAALNKEIKLELTPEQQKFEDEMNEFLHQEITWKQIRDFLFQEVTFGKKKKDAAK
jgi:glyceraldehyde-3-phosphate dehydrogenase/erythrose-4-phosphate dehydrogenase